MHWLVTPGPLLGNAVAQSGGPNPGHGLDPACDGGISIGPDLGRRTHRSGGVVSGYDVDRFRYFQYPRLLPRRGAHTRRRTRLSHFSCRRARGVTEYLHRTFHGTWRLVPDLGRRGNGRRQIRPRLVFELGTRLGRVRKSFCRARHYGSVLLHDHDSFVQGARPHAGLAKGSHQMVMLTDAEGSILQLRDVRKSFPDPGDPVNWRLVLPGISVTLAAGELVSLIGPSGCGKSTLLRLIAGLERPDSGELLIGSEGIRGPSAERGLVFQDPNLFPWLTVRRNIQAGLVARGLLQEKKGEVDQFMRLVGLETFANVYPHHLSGGMAQRAALARALINHPKILLLDEPLGALDAFTRMRMQDEVLRLWQARRTTMLLVTHDIDEAIYMSDRIVLMTPRPGRLERIIDVRLDRPRQRNSPEFLKLRSDILEHLHFTGEQSSGSGAVGTPRPTTPSEREPSPARSTPDSGLCTASEGSASLPP